MGQRRLAREIALQALYFLNISSPPSSEEAALLKVTGTKISQSTDDETLSFARALVQGAQAKQKEIDSAIETAALNWRLERMALVDKAILRLAAYELLFSHQTPAKAVIDEAIEITRKFSGEEATKFVNGILDKIAKRATKDDSRENSL